MINSATTILSVVVGDHDYDLNFTLQDSSGTPIVLTGATLTFEAQLESDLSISFSGAMSVISASDGTCSYTVASTDFPLAGVYNVQVVADFSSSKKITFDNIQITASPRVPQ